VDAVPFAVQLFAVTAAVLAILVVVAPVVWRTWLVRFGPSAVCWTTGWFGVPVHEGSHWLACVVLRRKVVAARWFEPDLAAGTLGRVEFAQGTGPLAWLASAAVGLAPLLGGTAALYGLAWLCGVDGLSTMAGALGHARSGAEFIGGLHTGAAAVIANVDAGLRGDGWQVASLVAWTWTSACVACHLAPSRADLALAWRGTLLAVLLTAAAVWGLDRAGLAVRGAVTQALQWVAAWTLPALTMALLSAAAFGLLGLLLRLVLPARR
jgi:hypothetical protein